MTLLGSTPQDAVNITLGSTCLIRTANSLAANPEKIKIT